MKASICHSRPVESRVIKPAINAVLRAINVVKDNLLIYYQKTLTVFIELK